MPETKSKSEVLAGMDEARDESRVIFEALKEQHPDAVKMLGQWWEMNYLAAGHKRLAYLLMDIPFPER